MEQGSGSEIELSPAIKTGEVLRLECTVPQRHFGGSLKPMKIPDLRIEITVPWVLQLTNPLGGPEKSADQS